MAQQLRLLKVLVTYTVAADGTVTFVPEKSFVGTAPAVTVVREDKNGTKASATYTPTVTPVTPTATPAETTDIQGATQTGKPVFRVELKLMALKNCANQRRCSSNI